MMSEFLWPVLALVVFSGEVRVSWEGVATFFSSWLLCGWRCFYWRSQCGQCCTHAVLFSALRTFGICVRASQRSSSIAPPPFPHPTSSSFHPSPKFWTCRAATHLHQNEGLQGQNALAIFLWQEGPFSPRICRERFAWEVLNWWSSPQGWTLGRLAAYRWRGNVCGWGCRWFCVAPITQTLRKLFFSAHLQSFSEMKKTKLRIYTSLSDCSLIQLI